MKTVAEEVVEFERRVHGLLAAVKYRDWSFRVANDGTARRYLQARFVAEDGTPQYGRKWILSPHMTDSEVVQTAFKAILTAVEHECREAFTFQGRAIFGPHIDVYALHEVADHLDARRPLEE